MKLENGNEPPNDIDEDFCNNFIAEGEDDSLFI